MRRATVILFCVPLLFALSHAFARGATLRTERLASGLSRPVFATSPPDDAQRLFVVEQHTGRIKIIDFDTEVVRSEPFLDIDGLATGNEQGLLGLAFHPDYANNGRFYVNLTVSGGDTQIREYHVSPDDPDRADPASVRTLLSYDQPFGNHNGGWIGFNPPLDGQDQYLHIGSGDGGSGNDPLGNAQTLSSPLGKILRIDVDGTNRGDYGVPEGNPFFRPDDGNRADDEIWAYGLRNPWRASFDRTTGDLWIGDVGQSSREEIDFQPGDSAGGENYGWRVKEGTQFTGLDGGTGPFVDPIYEYDNNSEGISVTGGYVYRGSMIPNLAGTYLFGDFAGPRGAGATIWSLRFDGNQVTDFVDRTAELTPDAGRLNRLASFAEDALGELYAIDLGGDIFRIVADVVLGDLDCNGQVDFDDINALVLALNDPAGYEEQFGLAPSVKGDMDGDGDLDFDDIGPFVEVFNSPADSLRSTVVAEPSSLALLAVAGLFFARRRGRRSCSA